MISRPFVYMLFALVPTLAGAAPAIDHALTPVQMIMNLQNLQVKIARGDAAALDAQSKMLRDIAIAFSTADANVWKDVGNRHAAVAYLLSGGAPGVISKLLESDILPRDDVLTRAALAYVLGHADEAEGLLSGLDIKTLDLRIAGQVAFAQSMVSKDSEKAIEALDLARLLAPGGLVEEASLRREIFLAGDVRDIDRFTALSREYLSRFPHSIYADNFLQGFGSIVARLGLAENLDNFHKFDDVVAMLAADQRVQLLLMIARAALLDGKVEVADFASNLSLEQGPHESGDVLRAKLYQGAARIMTAQYDAGLAELQGLDSKQLKKSDATLLAATLDLAARLHKAPDLAAMSEGTTLSADDGSMTTVNLAETVMARVDSLLVGKLQ